MTLRRVLSLLCLVVCAVAVTGCGGGDTLALDPVARAADTTAKTSSSRFAFSAQLNAGPIGTISFHGDGLFNGTRKSGWMNMHFSLPPEAQMQLGSTDPSMEMLFDGSHGLVMYIRSSLFDKMVPSGKWVKMDVGSLAKKEGVDLGALMNANQADPSQALRMLMASSDARAAGRASIRGVPTTHYAFRIDIKHLLHENKALEKFADTAGMSSIPADAWIDGQGRVRRLVVSMSLGGQIGTPMTMTIKEDLFDFGVNANITPPSDDMVVDYTALNGSGS